MVDDCLAEGACDHRVDLPRRQAVLRTYYAFIHPESEQNCSPKKVDMKRQYKSPARRSRTSMAIRGRPPAERDFHCQ
jgi:hypothetical protein